MVPQCMKHGCIIVVISWQHTPYSSDSLNLHLRIIWSLGVSNITTESQNQCYTGYFREPHWNSIGLPEISRVNWQLKNQPESQWCIDVLFWYRMRFDRNPIWVNLKFHHTVVKRIGSTSWQLVRHSKEFSQTLPMAHRRISYCGPQWKHALLRDELIASIFVYFGGYSFLLRFSKV